MSQPTPSRATLTAALLRMRLFAGLSEEDLNILLDIAEVRTTPPQEHLFDAGQPLDGGWLLLQGRVEIAEQPWPKRRLHRQVFSPGDLFGLPGFIKGWESRRTAVALEPTSALYLERRAFLRLIDSGSLAAFRIFDALLDLYVQDVQSVNQLLDDIYSRPWETLDLLRKHAQP